MLFWLAAGTAACAGEGDTLPRTQEMARQEVLITAGMATMVLEGMPSTRALEPMGPELENPIKQLAVIQFDEEGNLLRLNADESAEHPYFYWRDFTNGGELPGNLAITASDGFAVPLYTGLQTRVCLLGNLSEEEVNALTSLENGNPVRWADFLEKTVRVEYILEPDDPEGEVGHVRQIHLFGYYEGVLEGNNSLDDGGKFVSMDFTLARLIARLELDIRLGRDELGKLIALPEGHHLYWGLKGVERDVYLFSEQSRASYVHDHVEILPIDRTVEMQEAGGEGMFYFYVAPHLVLAEHKQNATYLQIWCTTEDDPAEVAKDTVIGEGYQEVLICNDPLQETPTAAGSLWINRNSIYHMSLTLTYEDSETRSKAGAGEARAVPVIPRRE